MFQAHAPYDFAAVHALLVRSFAYMQGRIDPPSSLAHMTPDSLAQEAAAQELWLIQHGPAPIACMILTAKPGTLYLGKLAVDPAWRGHGLAQQMIDHALTRATALGLPSVTLQTRVELTENHATFAALGFRQIAATAHPGFDHATSLTFERRLTTVASSA